MPNLDELKIQITASNSDVNRSINSLIGNLDKLNQKLGQLTGVRNYADSMRDLSKGLDAINQSISRVDSANIKNLVQNLSSLSIVTDKLSNGNPFSGLMTGLESLQGISDITPMNNLINLAQNLGKLGGSYAQGATQTLPQIAEGIKAFDGVTVPNISEELNTFSQALSGFGGKANTRTAGNLAFIADGLQQMSNIKLPEMSKIENISKLADALRKLGMAKVSQSVEVIPKVATALNQMFVTLSKAPVVSNNVVRVTEAVAQFVNSVGNLGNRSVLATRQTSGLFNRMGGWSKQAKSASKAGSGLAGTIGKIYATYWMLFRAFGKIKNSIGYASSLTEVQNVVDTAFGQMSYKIEEFSKDSIRQFGMSELAAKQYASRYQAMGSAMGITDEQVAKAHEGVIGKLSKVGNAYHELGDTAADMSINMTKLAADIGSFYDVDQKDVAEDLEAILTGMTRPLRTYGLDLTEATLKEWALKNGLDANIKTMSQAEKTMLRYQYVLAHTTNAQGDFAKTADSYANVVRTIGQQFQKLGSVIGSGFINLFKPFLISVRNAMNTVIELVEKALNAIGHLLGWEIEIQEVGISMADDMESYGDAIDDATGKAKELNKQLAGFDRLNNLTSQKDNGGGGTSGGESGAGGSQDKVTGGTFTKKPYVSDIDSWEELGARIASVVADAMPTDEEWQATIEKAKNFGKNLADFMNGLFAGEEGARLFEGLGSAIANSINASMAFWGSWADTIKWKDIGDNILAGIKKFLDEWDPELSGETLAKLARGIADTLYEVVSDKETWKLLGEKISAGINSFIKTMGKKDLEGKTGWDKLLGSFTALANGIGTAIYTAITETDWDKLLEDAFNGLKDSLSELTFEGTIGLIIGFALLTSAGRALTLGLAKKMITNALTSLGILGGGAGTTAAGATAFSFTTSLGATVLVTLVLNDIISTITGEESISSKISNAINDLIYGAQGQSKPIDIDYDKWVALGMPEKDKNGNYYNVKETVQTPWGERKTEGVRSDFLARSSAYTDEFLREKISRNNKYYYKDQSWYQNLPYEDRYSFDLQFQKDLENGLYDDLDFDKPIETLTKKMSSELRKIIYRNKTTSADDFISDAKNTGWYNQLSAGDKTNFNGIIQAKYGTTGITIDATANIKEVVSELPTSAVEILATAGIKEAKNELEGRNKELDGMKGVIGSIDNKKIPKAEKTVDGLKGGIQSLVNMVPKTESTVDKLKGGIQSIVNNIPKEQSYIDKMKGYITSFSDNVTSTKVLTDFKAGVTSIKDFVQNRELTDFVGIMMKAEDKLSDDERKIRDAVVMYKFGDDSQLSEKERYIKDAIAKYSKTDYSSLTDEDKTVKTKADFTSRKDKDLDKVFEATADFKKRFEDKLNKKFVSTAEFTSRIEDRLDKTFKSKADFMSRDDKKLDTIFDSKAKFTKRTTDKSTFSTEFDSRAKFTKRDYTSLNTTFNSTAQFTNTDKTHLTRSDLTITGIIAQIGEVITSAGQSVWNFITGNAEGGIFAGGHWNPIERYAVGGLPDTSQLFIAREAGPELVGTLGNHTAVMNNDQIVSSVSDGVAMAVSSVMAQEIQVLRQQNEYLSVIASKNVSISSKDVFNATRSEAQSYMSRTGRPAFG